MRKSYIFLILMLLSSICFSTSELNFNTQGFATKLIMQIKLSPDYYRNSDEDKKTKYNLGL